MLQCTKLHFLTEGIPTGQTVDESAPLSYTSILPENGRSMPPQSRQGIHEGRALRAAWLPFPSGLKPGVPWQFLYGVMSAVKTYPVDAFYMTPQSEAPEREELFQHLFTARTYATDATRTRQVYHCSACGQIRPRQMGQPPAWVELGMCPAQFDRSILPEQRTVQLLQQRISQLNDVLLQSRLLLSAIDRGEFVMLPGQLHERFRQAVEAAGDAYVFAGVDAS